VKWCGWYIHDTSVTFDSEGTSLALEDFDLVITPEQAQNESTPKPDLARLGAGLWNATDGAMVNSRVVLPHGELTVSDYAEDVVSRGRTFAKVATELTWVPTGARGILLSPLTGIDNSTLRIELKEDTEVRITNAMTRPSHDPEYARHFPEFFDFTAAMSKPNWGDRATPLARGGYGAQNSFCPPVGVKGP
jgi:hypothetical protein